MSEQLDVGGGTPSPTPFDITPWPTWFDANDDENEQGGTAWTT